MFSQGISLNAIVFAGKLEDTYNKVKIEETELIGAMHARARTHTHDARKDFCLN